LLFYFSRGLTRIFFPQRSAHQLRNRITRGLAVVKHCVYFIRDRHLESRTVREFLHCARGFDTLRNFAHLGSDLVERSSLAELFADKTVPRKTARTRQHQIAQSREPHEGLHLRAFAPCEPRDLREAARDERRNTVCAKTEARSHTRGDRHHVLHRSAQFGSYDVRVRVDPEVLKTQIVLNHSCRGNVLARSYDSSRMSVNDFFCE